MKVLEKSDLYIKGIENLREEIKNLDEVIEMHIEFPESTTGDQYVYRRREYMHELLLKLAKLSKDANINQLAHMVIQLQEKQFEYETKFNIEPTNS